MNVAPAPSALEHLDEILARASGRRLAVFLDYDGTLTPIVERPDAATLSASMRGRVARLAGRVPIAVVSGRDLADVRTRVGIEGITYAGSHGLDIEGVGGLHDVGAEAAAAVERATRSLRARLPDVPGLVVEQKRFGVAVHYRMVDPALVPVLERIVDRVIREIGGLRRRDGKKVFEVQPDVPWDKGRAVVRLAEILGGPAVVHPLYLGDDRTDEDAFRALRTSGTGILVAEEDRPTAARYRLRDPAEVGTLLDALTARASGG